MQELVRDWQAWVGAEGAIAVSAIVGLGIYGVAMFALRRAARRTPFPGDDIVLRRCAAPLGAALPLLLVLIALSATGAEWPVVRPIAATLFVFAVAWGLVRLVAAGKEITLTRLDVGARDNLHARKVQTQLTILHRIALLAIGLLAVGVALMNFEPMRRIGAGLLASAGVAGLFAGLAARRSLENVFAGIQIAFAQPIRLDDVVIVENEWGWIEEITLTYVVVRIWDLRRLVVPLSYFIEHPFENWTRTSADLLGAVTIHCDYTVPFAEVRAELERIVKDSPHWDGKVCRLHVTDASERSVELRALMSAGDSPSAWELRCEVREKLIDFLRLEHPESLPRLRTEVLGGTERASES